MLDLRFARSVPRATTMVAIAVATPADVEETAAEADASRNLPAGADPDHEDDDAPGDLEVLGTPPAGVDPDELAAFLREVKHKGRAGSVQTWVRPLQPVNRLLLAGAGDRAEAAWRKTGAALTRKAKGEERLAVLLPPDLSDAELRGLAEGLWLASYRFSLANDDDDAFKLRRVTLVTDGAAEPLEAALEAARATARMTMLARDLTNTPSDRKTPEWMARQFVREARDLSGVTVTVREPAQLAAEGFGGVLAVGRGSDRGPRFVEIAWRPRGASRHVVLVGKGITFDTGGICIKGRDAMKLMRKDMAGAAAVAAATLGAAIRKLPVRVTALVPLAENMVSGTAMRPGDVVRHYGGITTEVRNTDAEGRLVLADALQYAARRLRPDVLVDLATLTGATSVALGKRTAALFSDDGALAESAEA